MSEKQILVDNETSLEGRKRLEMEASNRGLTVSQLVERALDQYLRTASISKGQNGNGGSTVSNHPPVWLLGPKPVSQMDLQHLRDQCNELKITLNEMVEQAADSGQESGGISIRTVIGECDRLLETVRRNAAALETFDASGNSPVSYERLFRKLLNFDLVDEMVADPARRRELKRAYRRLYWFSLRRLDTQLKFAARRRSDTARNCPLDADIQGQFTDGLFCSYHLNRLRLAGALHSLGLWRPASRMALGSVMHIESALQVARV